MALGPDEPVFAFADEPAGQAAPCDVSNDCFVSREVKALQSSKLVDHGFVKIPSSLEPVYAAETWIPPKATDCGRGRMGYETTSRQHLVALADGPEQQGRRARRCLMAFAPRPVEVVIRAPPLGPPARAVRLLQIGLVPLRLLDRLLGVGDAFVGRVQRLLLQARQNDQFQPRRTLELVVQAKRDGSLGGVVHAEDLALHLAAPEPRGRDQPQFEGVVPLKAKRAVIDDVPVAEP